MDVTKPSRLRLQKLAVALLSTLASAKENAVTTAHLLVTIVVSVAPRHQIGRAQPSAECQHLSQYLSQPQKVNAHAQHLARSPSSFLMVVQAMAAMMATAASVCTTWMLA